MNAIVKPEAQEGAVTDYNGGLLEVIARAARDPSIDIDKLERLIAVQERVQAQQAKIAFTEAKLAMRPELPEITMRGHIIIRDKNDGNKVIQDTPFAKFEDIHEAVMPILTKHGFDLSFKNGLSPDGKVRVTTILDHIGGHSEDTYFDLPHDSSGSKNAVQAVGSSTSYAKRYGVLSILNIRVAGEDDNAATASEIVPQVVERQKAKDAPFPQGPARNKTDLKTMGRALWRDVEGCGDSIELTCLLGEKETIGIMAQLKEALPGWLDGYEKDGNQHDGLMDVIARKEREFTAEALERAR